MTATQWEILIEEVMELRKAGNAGELRDLFINSQNANIYMPGVRRMYEFSSVFGTMLSFMRSGRQVYNLSTELIEAFKSTKLDNLTWDDFRLPYDGFYIAVPPGTFRLWSGYEFGYRDAVGVYFRSAYDFEKEVCDFCMQINTACPDKHDEESDETYSWIGFKKSQFEHYGSFEKMIDAIFEADNGHKAPGIKGNAEREREQLGYLRSALRLAINLCAYLQQPKEYVDTRLDMQQENNRLRFENAHRERKRSIDEQRAMKRVTRISGVRLVHVGFARDPLNRSKLETGHMVSAHWHHYWCGPKSDRWLALLWLFEYFKPGSDGKSQIETKRTYEVKE